jgi:hypothetical protein
MNKAIGVCAIAILITCSIYFLYPMAIVELYGKKVPEKWMLNYADMNLGEIQKAIGLPQEEMSVKDYQSWLDSEWWGVKQLKIISANCCQLNTKPDEIIYLIRVKGWYEPAYQKIISAEGEGKK